MSDVFVKILKVKFSTTQDVRHVTSVTSYIF